LLKQAQRALRALAQRYLRFRPAIKSFGRSPAGSMRRRPFVTEQDIVDWAERYARRARWFKVAVLLAAVGVLLYFLLR